MVGDSLHHGGVGAATPLPVPLANQPKVDPVGSKDLQHQAKEDGVEELWEDPVPHGVDGEDSG